LIALLTLLSSGQEPKKVDAEQIAILDDKRINESSGLACGLRDPSIFWTHNDSGGEPCVFALDRQGRALAKIRIREAANFDWEDMASGPDAEGKPTLFVGDIGDNYKVRPSVQIYQISEPALPADPAKEAESEKPHIWHLTYPDHPHNAESLLVHPKTGRIFIVTKTDDGRCAIYACPQKLVADKAMVLEKIADLDFPPTPRTGKRPKDASQTTAASFSRDGSHLVIATYSRLHEWEIAAEEPLSVALKRPARILVPPLIPQMEAVCYDADGNYLWFTSERLPAPLWRMKVTR